jgi:hypothetical protein
MSDEGNQNSNRRGPLMAMAAVVVLAIVGWLLARELMASARVQDCVLSGRTNCAPLR